MSSLRTRRYRAAVGAAETRARELIGLVGPTRYAAVEAGILSYGQKKLVALAAALMPKPKLVVLDEPVAGVNPSRIREVEDVLRQLNQAGVTLLIVEHNVEFITNLCDNVIVLDQGRKLAEGPAAQVHQDPRVLEAYLGLGARDASGARSRMSAPILELVSSDGGLRHEPDRARLLHATRGRQHHHDDRRQRRRQVDLAARDLRHQPLVLRRDRVSAASRSSASIRWDRLKRGIGFVPQGRCNFAA